MYRALAVISLVSCAHHARATVTGRELYEQVQALQQTGSATIGAVVVRKTEVLSSEGQVFEIDQVIDHCRGGDPKSDADCTLALLLDTRFTILDRLPDGGSPKPAKEDRSSSGITSGVVVGLAVVATAGLIYGVSTCEFAGCKAVFGVPLVLIGGAALFALGRD